MSLTTAFRSALIASASLMAAGAAHADVFMKMTGAPGEATTKGFEQQVMLSSASFSINNTPNFNQDGEIDGRSTYVAPITLTKSPDRASPKLMQAAQQNLGVGTVELSFTGPRTPGSPLTVQYKWILEGVHVNAYSVYPGATGEPPMETIQLSYTSLRYQYFPADPRSGRSTASEEIVIDSPDGSELGLEVVGCR